MPTLIRRCPACLVIVLAVGVMLGSTDRAAADDREYVIDGKVKAVNADKKQVTILRDNGKETTVTLTATTNIRLDGKLSSFDKIKEKLEVRCVYLLDSKYALHFGMYVEMDRPPYTGKR